jgi:metabolite-proton symporter
MLSACFLGTTFEWYDFFIYATAASLIFPNLFFPSESEFISQLAAFSSFAVGFLARPLGGLAIAHYGDVYGRKKMLIFSFVIMGVATVLIGLLPSYYQIGISAPICLILLRIIQGVGVGGEWGGAALMAVESAPKDKRGFYGGFVQIGVPAGMLLANAVFLVTTLLLTDDQFMSWGWRIPFLVSVFLVFIGLYVRSKLDETPAFSQNSVDDDTRGNSIPLYEVMKSCKKLLVLSSIMYSSTAMLGYILVAYLMSYGLNKLDFSRSEMIIIVMSGAFTWLLFSLWFSSLSDKYGRKAVFFIGSLFALLWAFPFVALMESREFYLALLSVVIFSVPVAATYAPMAAIFSELFPTKYRYTATTIGYQTGTILGGAFVPLIASSLLEFTGNPYSLSIYMSISLVCGILALICLPETSRIDIRQ